MLVTNPAQRAPLSEVLSHPWMVRGFRGPPDSHLVHREPLRADELDPQVFRQMKGFEFGSEDEIERKLKQDAMNPAGGGIGFVSPGMLQPRGEKQR